jgi:hypothetical protein
MRRVAATVFAAALVSGLSAGSALATDTDLPNLSTPAVTSGLIGGPSGPLGTEPNAFAEETSVFARSGGGQLLTNRRVAGAWSGFSNLGLSIVDDTAAVAFGRFKHAFVRGADNIVYTSQVTNGVAAGFSPLPGLKITGRVTAITVGQAIAVFARGQDNLGYVNTFSSGRWLGWRNLGTDTLSSDLSPVVFGTRLLVFARGANHAIYSKSVDFLAPRDSQPWGNLGGEYTSNITLAVVERRAASNFPGQQPDIGERTLFLFARTTDNDLYVMRALDEGRVNPRYFGFRRIGGISLTSDITAPAFTRGTKVTAVVRNERKGLSAITFDYDGSTQGFFSIQGDGSIEGNPVAIHPAQTAFDIGGTLFPENTEVYVRVNDLGLYMRKLGPDGRPIGNYVNLGGQLG